MKRQLEWRAAIDKDRHRGSLTRNIWGDPVARFTAAKAFSTASAGCAKNFVDKLLAAFPFKVKGISVDCGSEFMTEVEQACKDSGLVLFILPPNRSDLNGAVERAQGS